MDESNGPQFALSLHALAVKRKKQAEINFEATMEKRISTLMKRVKSTCLHQAARGQFEASIQVVPADEETRVSDLIMERIRQGMNELGLVYHKFHRDVTGGQTVTINFIPPEEKPLKLGCVFKCEWPKCDCRPHAAECVVKKNAMERRT